MKKKKKNLNFGVDLQTNDKFGIVKYLKKLTYSVHKFGIHINFQMGFHEYPKFVYMVYE